MKKNIPKIFFLLAIAAFSGAFFAFAQTEPTAEEIMEALQSTLAEKMYNFFADFSPANPGANTEVSAQITSYTFDVDRATITWILNGKKAGTGKKFSFTTANIGSQTTLHVYITTPDGFNLDKSFYFQTAEVDLLWETSVYVPPAYRGKSLAVSQSAVKVTAVPWGFKTADSNLIYEWSRNGKKVADSSGKGKKTFSFYGSAAGQDNVEVKISNSDQSAVSKNSVKIKIQDPKILFYEENPLEGPEYQKELGSAFTLVKSELILRAEPYFFSKRALSIISPEWLMNDKTVATPQKPNLLYLTVPAGTAQSSSSIKLTLSNSLNVLEAAEKTFQINFNTQ